MTMDYGYRVARRRRRRWVNRLIFRVAMCAGMYAGGEVAIFLHPPILFLHMS